MTRLALVNARVIDPASGLDTHGGVLVDDGLIRGAGPDVTAMQVGDVTVVDCAGRVLAPGLIDARVFVGEPGAEHRETLSTVSDAAAAGGVTTIVMMPDTDPVIDDIALVDFIRRRARDTAKIRVLPSAALTKGLKGAEMTEMGLLTEAGAVAFTDGRKTVANTLLLRRLMTYARDFDALVMNEPEDANLANAGVMNEGEFATRLGLGGIPKEAETIGLQRDLALAGLTGARYHAAQVSCAESATLLEIAKNDQLKVTSAVSINHLTLNENDIGAYRTFCKLAPPLRNEDDRMAMIEAVRTGLIDLIVSAHDPQDVDDKRRPFEEAANGAVGVETMLPALLRLFHDGAMTPLELLAPVTSRPAALLGLPQGRLTPGAPADLVIFDPDEPWVLERDSLHSRAKNTPFDEARFQGRVWRTYIGGECAFSDEAAHA